MTEKNFEDFFKLGNDCYSIGKLQEALTWYYKALETAHESNNIRNEMKSYFMSVLSMALLVTITRQKSILTNH